MIPRRDAIQRLSLLLGGVLSTQLTAGLLGQVLNTGASVEVTPDQVKLLAEAADVIIPDTDTPGAKAAGAGQFIVRVLRDCYVREEQAIFYEGLATIESASRSAHGRGFAEIDTAQRKELMKQTAKSDQAFFLRLRELTIAGYFTSEIGATKALEYLPVPGRFEGDVAMKLGQKAWAL
jgi:Gluconate 2-dehydrogenase subunit 3